MDTAYPKIIILSGQEEGQEHSLDGKEKVQIGRSDDNDLLLSDTSVSRRHVTLVLSDGSWCVQDLGARNGSFLNDKKLIADKNTKLANADVIRVGIYDLRFLESEVSESEIQKQSSYAKKPEEKEKAAVVATGDNEAPEDLEDVTENEAVMASQTDLQELELAQSDSSAELESHKAGKSLFVFIGIAAVFCLIGVALFLWHDRHSSEGDEGFSDISVQELKEDSVKKDNISASLGKSKKETAVAKDKKEESKVKTSTSNKGTVLSASQLNDADLEYRVFLDVMTEPLVATIILDDKDIGKTPLRKNISVKPNQVYTLFADFELRELNDVYRKKVEFKTKPDADVVELKIDAELGVLKIQKLPRRVEFYLEGYYDYDKLKANPVKISDVVYGKPIYLPYGKYIVELRELTKVAGSDNKVSVIRYQREYKINKANRVLKLLIPDKELQFFPANIKSTPNHAQVYYGGEKVGETPFVGSLPLGKKKLKVVKDGFFSHVATVEKTMNSVYELDVELKTSKIGELINESKEQVRNGQADAAINTLVDALKYGGTGKEKAEVYYLLGNAYLSQRDFKQAKPYFEKARSHKSFFSRGTLGLSKSYHGSGQKNQALKTVIEVLVNVNSKTSPALRGEANSVFKQISPVKSVVYLHSEPAGASVFVNEKRVSQDTPLILSDLGLGNYRMQFEKAGYEAYKTKQNIKVGEFVMIKVKLKPEKQ